MLVLKSAYLSTLNQDITLEQKVHTRIHASSVLRIILVEVKIEC